jgi:hypothetical protein
MYRLLVHTLSFLTLLSLVVSWQQILTMEILQLLCSCRYRLIALRPRLAGIPHHTRSLLFTDRITSDWLFSVLCHDRRSVGQSILEWSTHLWFTTRFLLSLDSCGFDDVGCSLSDERTSLSFTFAAGPRQRSHSRVRVLCDSRPYFTVSDSRLPSSSPPTTRRNTTDVFESASTRDSSVYMTSEPVSIITSWHRPRKEHRSSTLIQLLLIRNLLPSSGSCFVVCFAVYT